MLERQFLRGILALLAATFLVASCDVSLNPFAEDTGLFSIYGYLTPSDGPHYIRVKNLNDAVLDEEGDSLRAEVQLGNLASGETEVLVDSVVVFDGLATHNFRSEMDIELDKTYQVTVVRDDGRQGRATATMPRLTVADVVPESGAACFNAVRVDFPRIDKMRFIDAKVGLKYAGDVQWVNVPVVENFGEGLIIRFAPASYVDEVVPRTVTPFVDCDPKRYCNLLDDKKIRIAYTHFGPNWPADSALTDPLQSEVTNGTGVFGGLRRDTLLTTADANLRCPGSAAVPCRPVPVPCTQPPCRCPDV